MKVYAIARYTDGEVGVFPTENPERSVAAMRDVAEELFRYDADVRAVEIVQVVEECPVEKWREAYERDLYEELHAKYGNVASGDT